MVSAVRLFDAWEGILVAQVAGTMLASRGAAILSNTVAEQHAKRSEAPMSRNDHENCQLVQCIFQRI